MTESDLIQRAKAALEGVTPGPWTWDGDTFSDAAEHKCPHATQWTDHGPDLVRGNEDGSAIEEYSADNDVITSGGYDASGLEIKTADAEFIAAARTLVPELVAEVERLRGACKTLGGVVEGQCRMALDASGLHRLIDEDGDGDWGLVWERVAELGADNERLQATIERVRALCRDRLMDPHLEAETLAALEADR